MWQNFIVFLRNLWLTCILMCWTFYQSTMQATTRLIISLGYVNSRARCLKWLSMDVSFGTTASVKHKTMLASGFSQGWCAGVPEVACRGFTCFTAWQGCHGYPMLSARCDFWLHLPFRHHSPSSSIVDRFKQPWSKIFGLNKFNNFIK